MKYKQILKSKKRCHENFDIRISKEYPWKILSLLHDDLRQFVPESFSTQLDQVIRSRDISAYLELSNDFGLQSITPSDISLAEMRAKYQLTALLKKFLFPDGGDRRSCAVDTFLASEQRCRNYNIEGYKLLLHGRDPKVTEAFTYARAFVSKVLGTLPNIKDLIWSRHGPGASIGTTNGLVSQYHKFANWPYSVTIRAFGYGIALINSDKRWLGALEDDYRSRFDIPKHLIIDTRTFWHNVFTIVEGNRITTVPKSYLTDRTIAIEPTINLFLQLGVDGHIRSKLKSYDINLDDQAKNQELARLGSISGRFATIDLKAASDTISLKLCESLLEPEWYNFLCDLRSPNGEINKEYIKYDKISSMGNGYTFALESLIFSSIVHGVLRACRSTFSIRDCAIYGDDLIVPTEIVEDLITMLESCGFQLNLTKSFFDGNIRESCGADWFKGKLIRPIFLTDYPETIKGLFNDYNRLNRVLQLYWGIQRDESKASIFILNQMPRQFHTVTGPCSDENFDSYIHTNKPVNAVYSNGMWKYPSIISVPIKVKSPNFFFRKLMAYLRPCNEVSISSTGSVFQAYRRSAYRLTKTYSTASYWQTEYATKATIKKIIS